MAEERRTPRAGSSLDIPRHRQVLYAVLLTLCGLGVLELAARAFVANAPSTRWSQHAELVDALGLPDLNRILEPHPTLFWRIRPNLPPTTLTGRIADSEPLRFTVSSDAEGNRRTGDALPDANRHVLFLGDSCTFGLGVDDTETFAARVQERIAGMRSQNAGVPGYTAFQGRRRMELRAPEPPPDALVVAFLFNDDRRWDGRSDLETARALESPVARLQRSSGLVSLLGSLLRDPEPPRDDDRRPRLSDDEYADELRAIAAHCRPPACSPVFLLLPLRHQMARPVPLGKQLALARVAAELGAPLVDLVPPFVEGGGARLFVDAVHPTAEGHRLVADALEPVLRRALGEASE